MNHAQSYSDCRDVFADREDAAERAHQNAKAHLLCDPDALGEAVADYWQANDAEGCDLLTEWTLILADAELAINAVFNGEEIPASQMQAFRALGRQVIEAKRRIEMAAEDAT